jgi:hypothetical protein
MAALEELQTQKGGSVLKGAPLRWVTLPIGATAELKRHNFRVFSPRVVACSGLLRSAQQGVLAHLDITQRVREACADIISASWAKGKKDNAQAASDFLDTANSLLGAFDEAEHANAEATLAPSISSAPNCQPIPSFPGLPSESFFLSTDSVEEWLTVHIDSALVHSHGGEGQLPGRRGGWPLGKRRTIDGAG